MAKVLDWEIVVSSNFSRAITFSFWLMPLEKKRTPLSFNLLFQYTSTILRQEWLWHLITDEGLYAIEN